MNDIKRHPIPHPRKDHRMNERHTQGPLSVKDATTAELVSKVDAIKCECGPVRHWECNAGCKAEQRIAIQKTPNLSVNPGYVSKIDDESVIHPEFHQTLKVILAALDAIATADWTQWGELASPEEFVRWAKSRAAHTALLLRFAIVAKGKIIDLSALSQEVTASAETDALRDMLEDARAELALIRESLGVPYEPHQTLMERTLEAAQAKHSAAARDVQAERHRQITAEGWTPEHDDEHSHGEMALAASCYAEQGPEPYGVDYPAIPARWPWDADWWKPKDYRRNLVKAGALILAEIERLDRAATNAAATTEAANATTGGAE